MKPEAQRIAIAEACGWFPPKHPKVVELIKDWPHSKDREIWWLRPDGKEFAWLSDVPDYLNDLNAMHEAEKVLGEFGTPIWTQYQNNIAKGDVAVLCGVIAHATAAQRAEAFLRTLGLWKP